MNDCERASGGGLRTDVPDRKAAAASRETAVRDQGNAVAEPHPLKLGCWSQHLLHSRTSSRTLVADHHHVAGLDLPIQDRRGGAFFTLEDARWAAVAGELSNACGLDDRAVGGQVAEQDNQASML